MLIRHLEGNDAEPQKKAAKGKTYFNGTDSEDC